MCEIKIVLIVAASLLAAAGFCIYQVNSGKKVGHYSEIKSESPCEEEYKKNCFNGSRCYYLVADDNLACNCTWVYGGDCCERYMRFT